MVISSILKQGFMDAYMCFIHCPLFIDATLYIDNKPIIIFFLIKFMFIAQKDK